MQRSGIARNAPELRQECSLVTSFDRSVRLLLAGFDGRANAAEKYLDEYVASTDRCLYAGLRKTRSARIFCSGIRSIHCRMIRIAANAWATKSVCALCYFGQR